MSRSFFALAVLFIHGMEDLGGCPDILGGNAFVENHPDEFIQNGVNQQPLFLGFAAELVVGQAGGGDIQQQDIGLDGFGVRGYDDVQILEQGSAQGTVVMVLLEPASVVLQGIDAGGCNDAGLAHTAANHFPGIPGLPDEGIGAAEQGANGGRQALGQAEIYGIRVLAQPGHGGFKVQGGIKNPHAIGVDGHVVLLGQCVDLFQAFFRNAGAAREIMRIFQAEQGNTAFFQLVFNDIQVRLEIFIQRVRSPLELAKAGRKSGFLAFVQVLEIVDQYTVSWPAPGKQGRQIGHTAGTAEQPRFLAGKGSCQVFQFVYRGVLAPAIFVNASVIAYRGGEDGFQHGQVRLG